MSKEIFGFRDIDGDLITLKEWHDGDIGVRINQGDQVRLDPETARGLEEALRLHRINTVAGVEPEPKPEPVAELPEGWAESSQDIRAMRRALDRIAGILGRLPVPAPEPVKTGCCEHPAQSHRRPGCLVERHEADKDDPTEWDSLGYCPCTSDPNRK